MNGCLICSLLNGEGDFVSIYFIGMMFMSILAGIINLVLFFRFKEPFIPRGIGILDAINPDCKKKSGVRYLTLGIVTLALPFFTPLAFIFFIIYVILTVIFGILRWLS